MNPFLPPTKEQAFPLREEHCQQMYIEAIQKAIERGQQSDTPATLPLDRLQYVARIYGPESLLLHPSDLAPLFAGMTSAAYQTIYELYCSRLGRGIPLVWQILQAMARQAHETAPSYEAVWACCLSFEQQRRELLTVEIERGSQTWWMSHLVLHCTLWAKFQEQGPLLAPRLVCLVDTSTNHVLACRLTPEAAGEEQCALTLLDGFLAQRRFKRYAPGGLIWSFPQRLVTDLPLPRDCQLACHALQILLEHSDDPPAIFQELRDTWAAGLTGRVLHKEQCQLLFDAYIQKYCPPGPLRIQEQQSHHYGHLLGYQRDAAWQFPLLRLLLPKRKGTITAGGRIEFQGWHYHNSLLTYWPHHTVQLRCSPFLDALVPRDAQRALAQQ